MKQDDINEFEWRDPANWTWRGPLGLYSSKRDTRLIVPKTIRQMGWTVNFAHPGITRFLIAIALAPLLFLLIAHVRA